MGPKKADNTNKPRRPSQSNIGTVEDQGSFIFFCSSIFEKQISYRNSAMCG